MSTRATLVGVGVIVGLTCALPPRLPALSVGDVAVRTPLGKPLAAEIPLQLTPQEFAQGVTATIGDQQEYHAEKLPRPEVADMLDATVITGPRDFIRLTSHSPIETGAFDLVLLVRTGQVTIVKSYHVTLAAPPAPPPSAALPAAEALGAEGSRSRPPKAPPAAPAPVPPKKTVPPPAPVAWWQRLPARYGPILGGGTLYGVAEELGVPKEGLWQALVLLWQANKAEFFGGNMHGVRPGTYLTIPPNLAERMATLSKAEAQRLVAEQWDEWQTLRRTPGGPPAGSPAEKAAVTLTKKAFSSSDEGDLPMPTSAARAPGKGVGGGQASPAIVGPDADSILQRVDELLSQRFAQVEAPGGAVTFVSTTEFQGALQGLEDRVLQRVQESITSGTQTPSTIVSGGFPPQPERSVFLEQWLSASAMAYMLVIENTLLLLFAGAMLWRWLRSRA